MLRLIMLSTHQENIKVYYLSNGGFFGRGRKDFPNHPKMTRRKGNRGFLGIFTMGNGMGPK